MSRCFAEANVLFLHVPSSSEMPEGQELQEASGAREALVVPQCPPSATLGAFWACAQPHAPAAQQPSKCVFVEDQGEAICLASQAGTQNTISCPSRVLPGDWVWLVEHWRNLLWAGLAFMGKSRDPATGRTYVV